MYPTMHADLVFHGRFENRVTCLGMQLRADSRDKEGDLNRVLLQQLKDSRHSHTRTVLASGQRLRRGMSAAKKSRFRIHVEGQRYGDTCTAWPHLRSQIPAGANLVDNTFDLREIPLPYRRFFLGNKPGGEEQNNGGAHNLLKYSVAQAARRRPQ